MASASPPTGGDPPGTDVLVAIDVGTSGARASAFDTSGTPVREVRRSYPTFLPAEGWAEQDARRWQSAALSALGALVESLGHALPCARCRSHGAVPERRSAGPPGQATAPGHHLPGQPGHRARRRGCANASATRKLHRLTGHVPAAFHVAAKVLWIRAHEPEIFAATRRFVQPTDYVGARH